MVNRPWTTWGVGLIVLIIVGIAVFWFVNLLVGFAVVILKLGLIAVVGLALVYAGKELYDGWSRAG